MEPYDAEAIFHKLVITEREYRTRTTAYIQKVTSTCYINYKFYRYRTRMTAYIQKVTSTVISITKFYKYNDKNWISL